MFRNRINFMKIACSATIPLPEMCTAGNPNSHSHQAIRESTAMRKASDTNNACLQPSKLRRDQGVAKKSERRRPRIALYSHDTMGLGHLRRNLLIAQSLAESKMQATSLLISGALEANFFTLPVGVDCLTLPRLQKDRNGKYVAGNLGISVNDLVCLRAESICSAMKAFQPDVFVVDKVPAGAFGELLPTLRFLKQQIGTKCVLGIRDILDAPETVHAEWEASESHKVVTEFFDEIWVYGDSHVYDPAVEYSWPPGNIEKVRYTGYLNQSGRLAGTTGQVLKPIDGLDPESDQLIVCTLGGGQDGYGLARAFVDSLPDSGFQGVLLAGPFMTVEHLRSLQKKSANRSNLRVVKFSSEADQLINRADRVIAMAGYNTVCSILSFQKRALLVPRVFPRSEQWIRAQKLQQLGFVDVLHPDDVSPTALRRWLVSDSPKPPKASDEIDLNGLARIKEFCSALVKKNSPKHTSLSREVV